MVEVNVAHLILWIIAAILLITLAETHFRLIEWLIQGFARLWDPRFKIGDQDLKKLGTPRRNITRKRDIMTHHKRSWDFGPKFFQDPLFSSNHSIPLILQPELVRCWDNVTHNEEATFWKSVWKNILPMECVFDSYQGDINVFEVTGLNILLFYHFL